MKFLFWLISSRGSEEIETMTVKERPTKRQIEKWCSTFHCWDSSENSIRYGAKKLTEKLHVQVKRYLAAKEQSRKLTFTVSEFYKTKSWKENRAIIKRAKRKIFS